MRKVEVFCRIMIKSWTKTTKWLHKFDSGNLARQTQASEDEVTVAIVIDSRKFKKTTIKSQAIYVLTH